MFHDISINHALDAMSEMYPQEAEWQNLNSLLSHLDFAYTLLARHI